MLALACRNSPGLLVLGHVVHDMRSSETALDDTSHVERLGEQLGIPVQIRSISCKDTGDNTESVARTRRYEALQEIAREHACPAITTAHHADDQLETMLMRLFRGSGLKGLSGISPIRRLCSGCAIIRPMLAISHSDAIDMCKRCDIAWNHDTTNDDTSRSRAYIRHTLLPLVREKFANASEHATTTAGIVSQAQKLVQSCALDVLESAIVERSNTYVVFKRSTLRKAMQIEVGEIVRHVARDISENTSMDRVTHSVVVPLVRAIRSPDGSTKSHQTGRVIWTITGDCVTAAKRQE